MLHKELFIGPVTSVEFYPAITNENAVEYNSHCHVILVACGPWLTIYLNGQADMDVLSATDSYLVFDNQEGGMIYGMRKCRGVICTDDNSGGRTKDIWLFHGGRNMAFMILDPDSFTVTCDEGKPQSCSETLYP